MKIKDSIIDRLIDFFSWNRSDSNKSQQNTVTIKAEEGSNIYIDKVIGGNQKTFSNIDNKTLPKFNKKSPDSYTPDHSPIECDFDIKDSRYKARIKEAEDLQKKWNFHEAIDIYIEILSDNPTPHIYFLVYVNLSICYLNLSSRSDNYSKAKKYLDKAELVENSQNIEKLYYIKAIYYFHMNDLDQANINIRKAIDLKNDYFRAINIKSLIQEKCGEQIPDILNENFFKDKNILKDIFQNQPSSYKTIGQLYLKNNEFDNAIVWFKQALEISREDIVVLSFLGDSYLFRAIDGDFEQEIIFTRNKLADLAESVTYYELAYNIGKKTNIPEDLRYFLINYSASLLFLGKHKEAYEKIQKALSFGLDNDELFLNKARVETSLGNYEDAIQSYNNISDDNRFFEKALIYIVEGKFKKCISYLKSKLADDTVENKSKIIAQELLVEALIGDNKLDESKDILLSISRSGNESWRTHVSWSRYYEQTGFFEKCLDHIKIALHESDNHPQCVVEAVNIFGRNDKFDLIIDKLNNIIETNDCEQISFKRFVFVNLAKAYFYNRNLYDVITTVQKAISLGIDNSAFYKILIETYRDLGNYSNALKYTLLEHERNPNDYSLYFTLGNFSLRCGQLEDGISYFKNAVQFFGSGKTDSSIYIGLGQAFILLGDDENAIKYATLAKDADIEIPKSNAHAFFMHTSLRCGSTDSSLQYMIDYNSNYPRNSLVKSIPSLIKDTDGNDVLAPEFVEFLDNQSREFNKILDTYKNNKVPLSFLANHFKQPISSIYEWRNIYNIYINVGTGNPTIHNEEVKKCEQIDRIAIDFLSLLIFARIGLLNNLITEFRFIYISHLTIEEIINSVLFADNKLVTKIWNTIRNSPKIKLFTKGSNTEYIPEDLQEIFGHSLNDTISFSKENNISHCVGDFVIREYLKNESIKTISPLVLLNRLLRNNTISMLEYSEAKLSLMKENHYFVSFNEHEILCVAKNDDYNIDINCNIYFDYLLTSDPDVLSFVNVYMRMFVYLFKNITDIHLLQRWVIKYTSVFNRLYLNTLFKNRYFLNSRFKSPTYHDSTFLSKLIPSEIAFLQFLVIVETIELEAGVKKQLLNCMADKITQADLFILFHNKLRPHAKKFAVQIKNEKSDKSSNI